MPTTTACSACTCSTADDAHAHLSAAVEALALGHKLLGLCNVALLQGPARDSHALRQQVACMALAHEPVSQVS